MAGKFLTMSHPPPMPPAGVSPMMDMLKSRIVVDVAHNFFHNISSVGKIYFISRATSLGEMAPP